MKVKQTLTKKQRKMKFNSAIASIIWGAMVLTGCPTEPEIPTYPETLVDSEKETIASLNGNTYSELLANIDTILKIKNIPDEYKAQLQEVIDVLKNQEFLAETYNNFSDSFIEKQEMIIYENMDVREQKSNDNYTNYSTYEKLYDNYKSKVEEFNKKIQGYNDVKVNYNADYSDYENAYNTLNNAGIKTDAYNDLINFMISIRDDFKDNYLLDRKENLASYTKENAETLFNNAVAENNDNKIVDEELASTKEEYDTSKKSVENIHAVKSDIDAAYSAAQDADTDESTFEFTTKENGKDDPVIGDQSNIFTYYDNATVDVSNYKEGDDITISIPAKEGENDTTVNIKKLYEQYTAIAEKVGENGSVSISYANAANTTIEGELYMNNHLDMNAVNEKRYAHIKSFVDAIKTSVSNNNYPTINMSMTSRTMTDETPFNLYHTGIADLLNLYYNNDMEDKISSFSTSSSAEFDAVDYLNRDERGDLKGKVYDNQEEYIEDSYYNLDVNAALLMNANLKNVNVTGAVSGEKKTFEGTFTNVRFGEDTTGFTFSDSAAGIGLIEFAGDAPSVTPRVNAGRLVLRNASSKVSFQGGFSIDVSGISDENAINTNINHSKAGFIEVIYPTQETANTSKFTPESIRVGNNLISGPDYYATNQQWVKAANEDKWNEYGEGKYPNKELLSKAKLDEKNNTLLNTILFNNQKVYG